MSRTITSANAKFSIAVPGAGLGPFTLSGYAADAAFAVESTEQSVSLMGVDGVASTGYVPALTTMTVTLQPDSDSIAFFEAWANAQTLAREAFIGRAAIDIPSVQRSYQIGHLALQQVQKVPGAQRLLQPMTYQLVAAEIVVTPLIQVAA